MRANPEDGTTMTEDEVYEEVREETETPEVVEAPAEPPARDWTDEQEAAAVEWGWKSPDQWEGEKPIGYIDNPVRFVERFEKLLPVQKLQESVEAKQREYDERMRKLEAMNNHALEMQRKHYAAQLADIERQERKAVELGDTDAYDALKAQKSTLESQKPPEQEAAPPPDQNFDPVRDEYIKQNAWTKDPVLWNAAVMAVNGMPNLETANTAEQLVYAEKAVREYFPHKFTKPKPAPQRQMVDGGGLAGGGGKSAFDKLPSEHKATFQRFYKQGLYGDKKIEAAKAEYLEAYNES